MGVPDKPCSFSGCVSLADVEVGTEALTGERQFALRGLLRLLSFLRENDAATGVKQRTVPGDTISETNPFRDCLAMKGARAGDQFSAPTLPSGAISPSLR